MQNICILKKAYYITKVHKAKFQIRMYKIPKIGVPHS